MAYSFLSCLYLFFFPKSIWVHDCTFMFHLEWPFFSLTPYVSQVRVDSLLRLLDVMGYDCMNLDGVIELSGWGT
jgi:hypothetical protein